MHSWTTTESKKSKRNFFKNHETNENGNPTYQNLLDVANAVLIGKFIVINAFIKKKVLNKLTLHLK